MQQRQAAPSVGAAPRGAGDALSRRLGGRGERRRRAGRVLRLCLPLLPRHQWRRRPAAARGPAAEGGLARAAGARAGQRGRRPCQPRRGAAGPVPPVPRRACSRSAGRPRRWSPQAVQESGVRREGETRRRPRRARPQYRAGPRDRRHRHARPSSSATRCSRARSATTRSRRRSRGAGRTLALPAAGHHQGVTRRRPGPMSPGAPNDWKRRGSTCSVESPPIPSPPGELSP